MTERPEMTVSEFERCRDVALEHLLPLNMLCEHGVSQSLSQKFLVKNNFESFQKLSDLQMNAYNEYIMVRISTAFKNIYLNNPYPISNDREAQSWAYAGILSEMLGVGF